MKYLIIGLVVLIFTIVVLCLILKLEKSREQEIEKELESVVKQNEINASYNKEMIKNEEQLSEIHSGNTLTNFNNGVELLQKQSAKGKKRNNS